MDPIDAGVSSPRRRRVAIVNVYEDDNRGGAALTLAAVRVANDLVPDAEIVIVPVRSTTPRALRHVRAAYDVTVLDPLVVPGDGRLGTVAALVASVLVLLGIGTRFGGARPATLRAIRDADLVISRGGVIFTQRRAALGDHARLWLAVLPCVLAGRYRRPLVLVGAQVGPVITRLGRVILRAALARADFVWARGPRSTEAARSLIGRRGRVVQAPDSVFVLDAVPAAAERAGVVLVVGGDQALAGAAVPAVGEWLAGHDGSCTILQQVHGDHSDRRWLERLRTVVDVDDDTVLDEDLGVDAFMRVLAGAELVVSTRMHSVLLSLLNGTPAVAVLIDDAYRKLDVLEGLGVPELATTAEDLAATIERTRLLTPAAIEAKSAEWRRAAAAVVDEMRAVVALGE